MNNIFKLEHEIREIIYKDNKCDTSFIYGNTYKVYTYNPSHNKSFLLYENNELDKEKFLTNVLNFIKNKLPSQSIKTYTVKWSDGNGKTFESYFAVNDFEEIAKKFYSDKTKNKHDYTIYSCTLNPIS